MKNSRFQLGVHNGAPLFVVVTSTQVFLVLHGSQSPQKTRDDVMDMWHGIYGIWGLGSLMIEPKVFDES